MVKTHLLLESEQKVRFIDERKYRERHLLEKAQHIAENNDPGRVPLLKEQQIVLKDYFERLLSENRIKARTIYQYIVHLHALGSTLKKPYSSITQQDLISCLADRHRKGQSPNTIIIQQCIMRQFFTWLGKKDIIAWIKFAKRRKRELTPESLLTPEEIKKLVFVSQHERDKCLLIMTYEGALRLGEVAHIQIKDIVENEHGITVRVDGKTGVRSILLIDSVPYYKVWLAKHEYRNEPEAYLFYNFAKRDYGRGLGEKGVSDAVRRAVFPHLFRHSRLDYLGRQGFRERDLKIFAGWSEDSRMANTYLHYGQEEVDKKLLALKGIRLDQEKTIDTTFQPITCASCDKQHPPTTMYCNCGELLVEDKRAKADAIMNKLFDYPEFKDLVKKLLAEEMKKNTS